MSDVLHTRAGHAPENKVTAAATATEQATAAIAAVMEQLATHFPAPRNALGVYTNPLMVQAVCSDAAVRLSTISERLRAVQWPRSEDYDEVAR
ncbi:MAG: hypothetical protein IT481_08395 [Gammaproteobacteria bacterium]|nr:hypothetical protein [Gammaproteobacteria bacterium]